MITKTQIETIKNKIFELISDQVKFGSQQSGLQDDVLACGQFLDRDRKQRGVHGTSSALRVLATSVNDDINLIIPKLVKYLETRNQIEVEINPAKKKEVEIDDNNVIKLSEVLYSLSLITAAQGNPNLLINTIKDKINHCKLQEKGWGYFVNSTGNPELLPTAFAIMGLYANGFNNHPGAIKFIAEELVKEITNPTTFAIAVFSLYVLVFKVDKMFVGELINVRGAMGKILNSKFCVIDSDIEQNIEYWLDEEHFYVRIPWQLYLIALASRLSSWTFSKNKIQNILSSIFNSYRTNGGFKYKYSGNFLSTRTNAIVFDSMNIVGSNLRLLLLYRFFNWIDFVREIISSKWARWIKNIILVFVILYPIYLWFSFSVGTMHDKLMELAPHGLAIIVVIVLELGKKSK